MGKRSRRCIVPNCTYSLEIAKFFDDLRTHGSGLCPLHRQDSKICGCDETSSLRALHRFPKDPDLKSVWFLLCKLDPEYAPSTNEFICSQHFEIGGNQKVPTKNIGRSEAEIEAILSDHTKKVVLKQLERQQMTKLYSASSSQSRVVQQRIFVDKSYPSLPLEAENGNNGENLEEPQTEYTVKAENVEEGYLLPEKSENAPCNNAIIVVEGEQKLDIVKNEPVSSLPLAQISVDTPQQSVPSPSTLSASMPSEMHRTITAGPEPKRPRLHPPEEPIACVIEKEQLEQLFHKCPRAECAALIDQNFLEISSIAGIVVVCYICANGHHGSWRSRT